MGAIEEKKIEELAALTLLVNRIAQKNAEIGFDIKRDFPQFLWVLRDFTLDLETNSAQEYLDKCLEDVSTQDVRNEKDLADIRSKNGLRKQIKNCFMNRMCLAFGRPANDETILKNIESDDQIKAEFKADVDDLMKFITLSIHPKTANKSLLTGNIFFKFLEDLISSINSGETPMLNSGIDRLLTNETEIKTKKVLSSCNIALDALKERLPMSDGDLARKFNDIAFEYLELLRENIMYIATRDIYSKNVKLFIKSVKEKYAELEEKNTIMRKQQTTSLISTFEAALPQPRLEVDTGFDNFVTSLKPLFTTYFGTTANRDRLEWSEVSGYLIESLFSQFDGAIARAKLSQENQVANLEHSIEEEKDRNRRLKLQISELEAGLDEVRRGNLIKQERSEMEVESAKDVELKVLREKVAKLEAKMEKEKESQNNFRKVFLE